MPLSPPSLLFLADEDISSPTLLAPAKVKLIGKETKRFKAKGMPFAQSGT